MFPENYHPNKYPSLEFKFLKMVKVNMPLLLFQLSDLEHKESTASLPPFPRMKVKLKKEIVTMGQPDVDPKARVGHYVEAHEWNELISAPDVVVIDTRNDYEVGIGTFEGAINPNTKVIECIK